jgi:hypothetical protein
VKKGVIMDIDERFLTLLTPEGEFLKAQKLNQDYLIGEEMVFLPVSDSKNKAPFFRKRVIGKPLIAAACALIVATSFIPFLNDNEVYAYMSIDVNPSIELAVNDDLEVVGLEAYNPEGELVLSSIKGWKHKEVDRVTSTIIEEMKKQGYFKQTDKIVISTVYDQEEKLKVKQKLETNIVKIEEKIAKHNLEVTIVQATKEEREMAHKQGITAGEYKEKQKENSKNDHKNTNSITIDPKTPAETKKDDKGQVKEEMKGKTNSPGKVKKENSNKKEDNQKKVKQTDSDKQDKDVKSKPNEQKDNNSTKGNEDGHKKDKGNENGQKKNKNIENGQKRNNNTENGQKNNHKSKNHDLPKNNHKIKNENKNKNNDKD